MLASPRSFAVHRFIAEFILVDWVVKRKVRTPQGSARGNAPREFSQGAPFGRICRNSGTERMSRALILETGTGVFRGAAGVKTVKLCVEQDQIGGQAGYGLLK